MLTIKCDLTGTEEVISSEQVEVREGKAPNTWVWVIKGIEKLQNFAPNAYDKELNLLLSRSAQLTWNEKDKQLQEAARTEKVKAIKLLKKK